MVFAGSNEQRRRVCFVTIGATAKFDSLIKAVLSPSFLQALQVMAYTDLVIQYGTEGAKIYKEFIDANPVGSQGQCGLEISGFGFNKQGLGAEMRSAKGDTIGSTGVVFSHAGSGSILNALRIAVPIVVVPNPDLLDNHQVELAEELSRQGYVVYGHLNDLPVALKDSEKLREKHNGWPPSRNGQDPSGRGLAGVMDDEMGFVD